MFTRPRLLLPGPQEVPQRAVSCYCLHLLLQEAYIVTYSYFMFPILPETAIHILMFISEFADAILEPIALLLLCVTLLLLRMAARLLSENPDFDWFDLLLM